MALINLNINSFKKNAGGIADRLVDRAIGRAQSRLENTIEDAVAKQLSKVGISGTIAAEFTSRFNDAFSVGKADDFFRSSTAEQNRVTAKESIDNMKKSPGTSSGNPPETAAQATASISSPSVSISDKFFQFPEKLGDYYMLMKFKEYRRPSPQSNAETVHFDTFAFPIPRDIKESFDINVSEKPQGMVGGIADVGTAAFRGQSASDTKDQLRAIAYSAAVQATESLGLADTLGQFTGVIPNPHVQAIFEGVGLRKHTFSWTFAPRNPQESILLRTIIDKMKANSLPAYSNLGTAALQYPPLVDIELRPGEIEELIKFKTCIISNVSVNYAPQGLPSFFQGTRQPTMIQLTVDMMETMIQTANDYGVITGQKSGNTRNDRATELYDKLKERPIIGAAITAGEDAAVKAIQSIQQGAR